MTDAVVKDPGATGPAPAHQDRSARANNAPPEPLTLAELQDLFLRAVMSGDKTILTSIPGNGRTTAAVLLGVYQHAYKGRLADILAIDHPLLHQHMGAEAFEAMAYAYIDAHPSDTPNVRWFARQLPEFLESVPSYAARPDYSELAALERALSNAFDAADDPVVTMADLQSVPPESWAALHFTPHSAASRLTTTCQTYARWQALQSETEPPAVEQATERQQLIVWRKDDVARVRVMGDEEAMMWDEAMRGVPFGRLCELVATFDDPGTAPLRAAQYLQGWIAAELLTAATVG